jgi:hypothetical protein
MLLFSHRGGEMSTTVRTWRLIATALVFAGLLGTFGLAHDRDDDRDEGSYAIGLWGDVPYSDAQATIGVPNLIADMNRHDLAFTAHDGDLKTGNGAPICSDALYYTALTRFNSLNAPAIFTPGDNDWTDCDRPNNGGVNSLQQLDRERAIFFSTPFSLGKHRVKQDVQATPLCRSFGGPLVPCVENRRWTFGGVTYATLNIQGSCNNRCGDGADEDEWTYRNAANIAWMRETFAQASARHAAAVMFISQADPGFGPIEIDGPSRDPQTLAETDANPDGFQEFLVALREEAIAFGKPVAYVHGDSHYFRVDKPLLDRNGARVENFTRVETFGDHAEAGSNDVNWVKVLVSARSREVFAYQPQTVPGNAAALVP